MRPPRSRSPPRDEPGSQSSWDNRANEDEHTKRKSRAMLAWGTEDAVPEYTTKKFSRTTKRQKDYEAGLRRQTTARKTLQGYRFLRAGKDREYPIFACRDTLLKGYLSSVALNTRKGLLDTREKQRRQLQSRRDKASKAKAEAGKNAKRKATKEAKMEQKRRQKAARVEEWKTNKRDQEHFHCAQHQLPMRPHRRLLLHLCCDGKNQFD